MCVANPASYLDYLLLFHLRRPFKFISKVSNIIPIIGWLCMTGHTRSSARIARADEELGIAELQNKCACSSSLRDAIRRDDGGLKKGAFSVAAKEKALGARHSRARANECETGRSGCFAREASRLSCTSPSVARTPERAARRATR